MDCEPTKPIIVGSERMAANYLYHSFNSSASLVLLLGDLKYAVVFSAFYCPSYLLEIPDDTKLYIVVWTRQNLHFVTF